MIAVSLVALGCQSRRETQPSQPGANTAHQESRTPSSPNPIPALAVYQMGTGAAIKVDGILDEPSWISAASTGEFVDVGTGAPNQSRDIGGSAWLLWDADAIYIAVKIRDSDIRGDFAKDAVNPHLWTESAAEIMIDPDGDGDNRDYYEVQIGPQNLVFDSQFDDYNQPRVLPAGPFGHQQWSAHATCAVVLNGTLNDSHDTDQGYTIEAKIPWGVFDKAKTTPPKPNDQWRMNFYAMHNNGGVAWSPILGQGNFHRASRFGRVTWAGSIGAAP